MTPEQQAFLLHHYSGLAQVFLDGPARAKEGREGHCSRDLRWQVQNDGIGWSDENLIDPTGKAAEWPHHVTWRDIAQHWVSRPPGHQQALRNAYGALMGEYRDHRQRMLQIGANGYRDADGNTRDQLDAELRAHYDRLDHLKPALHDVLADLLPLASGSPVQEALFA